jgi:hypothetical protein
MAYYQTGCMDTIGRRFEAQLITLHVAMMSHIDHITGALAEADSDA